MTPAELKAENDKLRAEVDAYKQRELAYLRTQLAAALQDVEHYRSQAIEFANRVHEVNRMAEETIAKLTAQLNIEQQSKLAAIRNRPREPSRN